MDPQPYPYRALWEERIGVPDGWETDGPNGQYISKGRKQVWLDRDNMTFTIADGFWLPGVYADVKTAITAIGLPSITRSELNDQICHYQKENRAITMDDLKPYLPKRK